LLIFAGHSQYFGPRVLRVGFTWPDLRIVLKSLEGPLELRPGAGVEISDLVQRRGVIRINGESAFQQRLAFIPATLQDEPAPRLEQQPFVAGIEFQHIVHSGDGGNEIAFFRAGIPLDHQLLTAAGAWSKASGFCPRPNLFLRIRSVEADKKMRHRKVWI